MNTITQYKFLRKGMKSQNGNLTWKKNKWVKVRGKLDMCNNGLHSSEQPYDAFSYIHGEIIALVECRGEHLQDENKFCWREQRVIKTRRWTKKDSVRLAIYSAEQVISIFEKKYPEDKRPRKAIQAAKRWLKNPTAKNRADAAHAAAYAAYAAHAAAYAAYAAAAAAAAYAAANAAAHAAYAAHAARKILISKIQKYFVKMIREKGL